MTIDSYSRRHLAEHLFRSDMPDELYDLLIDPRWRRIAWETDTTGQGYARDVGLGFDAVAKRVLAGDRSRDGGQLSLDAARLAALALLAAGQKQSFRRIPAAAIEALAWLGDLQQAMQYARSAPEPISRAQMLARLGLALFQAGQAAEAHQSWNQALVLLQETPTDVFNDRFEVWTQLIEAMAEAGEVERAASVMQEMADVMDAARPETLSLSLQASVAKAWGRLGDEPRAEAAALAAVGADQQIVALCMAARGIWESGLTLPEEFLSAALERAPGMRDQVARSRLAECLAISGRLEEARRLAGDNLDQAHRGRLLWAAGEGTLARGETAAGVQTCLAALAQVLLLGEPAAKLRFLTQAVRRRWTLPPELHQALITALEGEWMALLESADPELLGEAALAWIRLGDLERARLVVGKALQRELPHSDWEEAEALAVIVEICGDTVDVAGLTWALEVAQARSNVWQQAELCYHIARAAQHANHSELSSRAESLLKAASEGPAQANPHPGTRVSLAIWQAVAVGRIDLARATLASVRSDLSQTSDVDELALVARALARAKCPELAADVLRWLLEALEAEEDANTRARVIGVAAEAAAAIPDPVFFGLLEARAYAIDVEWLRAEALFWIAGWRAALGYFVESRRIYLAAVEAGLWEPTIPAEIESEWTAGNPGWTIEVAAKAGWPSSQAAAAFAGIALLTEQFGPEDLGAALETWAAIPVDFGRIRAAAHRLLVRSIARWPDQPSASLRLWTEALRSGQNQDVGTVWAVVGASVSSLLGLLGAPFIGALWQELADADRLLRSPQTATEHG